jgi:hypothetical protein
MVTLTCAKDGEVGTIRTEQTSHGRLVEKGLIRQGWRLGLWNPVFWGSIRRRPRTVTRYGGVLFDS